ncbi:MAG: permease, partial [Planctomycetota bacterium]
MEVILGGGGIRMLQGVLSAAPTLIIGLFIASVLKFYLRTEGTNRLFGGSSLRALPQAWAVGMLLPVCSIGVIPIIREMRRQGIRPGAITAFALSAPLFNPLSLLYGLTLSRPLVIIGFALGSLLIVTVLGLVWDRAARSQKVDGGQDSSAIGLKRLAGCAIHMTRELAGPSGAYLLIAGAGLFLLGAILPHGSLQSEVEQLDPLAPLKMAAVSLLIYATPILTMSQLGMMFDHGNSPGSAFV